MNLQAQVGGLETAVFCIGTCTFSMEAVTALTKNVHFRLVKMPLLHCFMCKGISLFLISALLANF